MRPHSGLRRAVPLLAGSVATMLTGCHHVPTGYGANIPPPPLSSPAPATRAPAKRPAEPVPRAPEADDLTDRTPFSIETGLASWYGPPYHNRQAADGSIFDQNAMTAAHRTLPMGTTVRVTNLQTGDAVVVKITDRGPFVPNRILDLSLAAARAAGLYGMGVGKVKVEAFARAQPDDGGRWCVQIGAFLTQDDSVQLKNDLTRRYGTSARVIEFAGPTGHWVRVNPVQSDRATAQHILDSIHIPDADPYLVRLN